MKFSNFVSTLAVVCLAFNADALRVQGNQDYYRLKYYTANDLRKMFL